MIGRSNKQYAALPTDDVQGDDAPAPRSSVESTVSQQTLPYPVVSEKPKPTSLPTFVYVAIWIILSSSIILFNKWILHSLKFPFPLFLTTWHMVFASIMTQILAHATRILDSRHKVSMNHTFYLKTIVPIAIVYSVSLICGNMAYLFLSVSFIQMMKSTNAAATLLATWAFRLAPPNLRQLANVSVIVFGVTLATFGEANFSGFGFTLQACSIIFEATRLVLVQRLLNSNAEHKMDPLVSLYYFAPACAVLNGATTLLVEAPTMRWGQDFANLGALTLLANGAVAFALNVAAVMLIGKTSAVVLTLCGVLKDVSLVMASMVLFRDPVTVTQAGGYSIALGGLVYYKLGLDKIREGCGKLRDTWQGSCEEHGEELTVSMAAAMATALAMLFFGTYVAFQFSF
ncbi:putative sugar phosphate/phosphate translocator [Lasiodiplodia hormozganensis]|uniref:Sugar phosphate/phosphate translocator n=1 Tax=Lasiodiplodia hormozganensis TaxID=869390 RepID=A0AA39TUA7_9PEZI|nr:putative sugar phosphate/phosphate translocator [Lasiodiplodia hormozganensis]